ncbi:tRNA1(Val) (adenine(37)-N6)-methyltransferase [Maribacter sp. 2210JD10-5]|uniref:tRNA1(Val) (adenine(37)-N6)-methyltransferase n=1 Tax=Maribacter sp. 2210JD10-5 TaxID=3386272 RepID=UPI0039BD7421
MKVGTDAVLLGAWTTLEHLPQTILDIGTGTGLLSLMLAQRSNAEIIDAIEIDERAYEQCVENFETSVWADKLFCYHAGLDEFLDEVDQTYDLIISNPPFYTEEVASGNVSRDKARQTISLPFDELLESVSKLLSDDGIFSVVVPSKEEFMFVDLAKSFNLFPKRMTRVKGNNKTPVKRVLMEFGFEDKPTKIDELVIEVERHQYTRDYIDLTKAFYLKM